MDAAQLPYHLVLATTAPFRLIVVVQELLALFGWHRTACIPSTFEPGLVQYGVILKEGDIVLRPDGRDTDANVRRWDATLCAFVCFPCYLSLSHMQHFR